MMFSCSLHGMVLTSYHFQALSSLLSTVKTAHKHQTVVQTPMFLTVLALLQAVRSVHAFIEDCGSSPGAASMLNSLAYHRSLLEGLVQVCSRTRTSSVLQEERPHSCPTLAVRYFKRLDMCMCRFGSAALLCKSCSIVCAAVW